MIYIYHGPEHPYYEQNREYGITIERRWFGRILVYMPRYVGRAKGSLIKYRDFKAFKEDWRRK